MVLLASRCSSGASSLSLSSEGEESEIGEEGEKSAMNLCARLDLRLLMGLGVVVGDSGGGAACASQSVDGAGPWFSA